MIKGTVRWFDTRKGYGFIIPDGVENGRLVRDILVRYQNVGVGVNIKSIARLDCRDPSYARDGGIYPL